MTFLSSSLPTETNKGLSNFDFQVELHVHIVLFFIFLSLQFNTILSSQGSKKFITPE